MTTNKKSKGNYHVPRLLRGQVHLILIPSVLLHLQKNPKRKQ